MAKKKVKGAAHLYEHHGCYFARRRVPEKLQAALGLKEIWERIDPNLSTAKRRLPAALAKMQDRLDEAAARLTGSAPKPAKVSRHAMTPQELAQGHFRALLEFDNTRRNSGNPLEASFGFDPERVEALRRIISGRAGDEEMGETLFHAIVTYMRRGNITADVRTPEWREAVRALAVADLEATMIAADLDDGIISKPEHPMIVDPLPKPAPRANDPTAARRLGPDSNQPLSELVDLFLAERQISSGSQHEHKVSVRMFEEHLGEAKPVYQITRRDVLAYKTALLDLPSSYTKRFPGKTIPEAIAANKAMKTPFPTLDPRTVNDKWLSALRALLNWCVQNDFIPDNPSAGIKVNYQADKGTKPRIPFDPADIAKIFSKPLFDRAKPWGETQWSYLLSLYTGTRPSELAQVRLDSIRTERGILVLRVQEETKNEGSQRVIPLHKDLIILGLVEHVAKLRSSGATHLFPEWFHQGQDAKLKADRKAKATGAPASLDHHYPHFIPRRFNVTYRKRVGIEDKRKDFYAFRHSFKTGLALAGVSKDIRDALAGHADSSAGATYVHDISIEALKVAVDKLHFDGLTL